MNRKDTLQVFSQSSDAPLTVECVLDSVCELINSAPMYQSQFTSNSFQLLTHFLTVSTLEYSLDSHKFADYRLTNIVPDWVVPLEEAFQRLNSIVEIGKLVVTRVSEKLSLKVGQWYKCRECGKGFPVWADVLQSNKIQPPFSCLNSAGPSSPLPESKSALKTTAKCDSKDFDPVSNGEIYADYLEAKLTDGRNSVIGVLLGTLSNGVSVGDELTVLGAIGLRWFKDVNYGSEAEAEFLLQIVNFSRTPKSKIQRGLGPFAKVLESLSPFDRRAVIVKSSFTRVYQDYDLKLAGLLALVCHFCNSVCNVLVAGPRSTGKSIFLKAMSELGRDHIRSYHSAAQVLDKEKLWLIDNFHMLKDLQRLIPLMETSSVLATITTASLTEGNDKEAKKSKSLYQPGLTRCSQLPAELDRFDLVIFNPGYEDYDDFLIRKLNGDQMEEMDGTWDYDTLLNYLQYIACPLADVQLESSAVEELIHSFVGSVVRINMTQTQTQGQCYLSGRLVESLLKLARVLLGHRKVSKFDVTSCMMLMLQSKTNSGPSEIMDEDRFMEKLQEINRVYTMANL